ncbi:MAG: HAMP domain-containing histidine kinase [Lachnospiraceae bacterium]|nr:HAMP domain-containing histidine kinase [Lachnospiraceae bacterium]
MTENSKNRIRVLIPILICFMGMMGILFLGINHYRQLSFRHISNICQTMIEAHPETEAALLTSLKEYQAGFSQEEQGKEFLLSYGYKSSDFDDGFRFQLVFLAFMVFLFIIGSFMVHICYIERYNRRRIGELTNYLESVNIGKLDKIIQSREDNFSHLEDEIYKTVTMLRQTRDKAVKTKENYADNLANIAHQLKTKITTLSLGLQLLKKSNDIIYIQQMEAQLESLNWLEEALLTLSKLDAGVLQLECKKVDIYTALTLAAENLNELLVEKAVSVSISNKGCVEIDGDLEWTMEAFMNVIKNCIEHSNYGGEIHCDYSENPLYVEILIWDEGTGFMEEDIPHLFERFYKGKKPSKNGIGIGLSLARSIFEMQNGNIVARNKPEGGACFEIRVYSH